ncbi:MAG: hypothetical protein C4318_07890 [Acidimicrobiia bacterium]
MTAGGKDRAVVAIAGMGLMGASLGMALRSAALESGRSFEVRGWNRTYEVTERAARAGAVDRAFRDLEDAIEGCDFVFIATPVSTVVELAIRAAKAAPDGCIVSDVGSVKARIVRDVERAIPSGKHFIGGHPMCGSELSGLEAARADLYKGATWVLTPTETTDSQALADLSGVVSETGAKVLAVRPDEHDRFVGVVSHLPHVVAAALMDFVSRKASSEAALAKLAAGGLRDVTRIAAGSPEIWTDILTWNGEAVVEALEELQKRLGEVKEWLAGSDAVRLKTFLLEARAARNEFFVKREAKGAFWEVAVAIEDRPGALAQVTTLVGQRGINISDVTITHPVEAGSGGAGLLRLTIEGEDEAIAAGQALREAGFRASVRPQSPPLDDDSDRRS